MPLVIEGRTLYTTAEAADLLGIAHQTAKNAIATGALGYEEINARLNMVPEEAVERYRREHLGRRGRPRGSRNKSKADGDASSHGAAACDRGGMARKRASADE